MSEKKCISEIKKLMQEWDYEANKDLDPIKLTIGSNKKAWWKSYLCGHRWQTSISHRTREGRNSCPNCHYGHWSKGRKNLTQTNPDIVKDWDYTKNGKLTPDMFKPNSGHKVWWICPKCGYEYESKIGHRIGKHPTSCPKCGIEKSNFAKNKPINMIDLKTHKVIRTFKSISDASREMKVSSGNITAVCKGTRTKASGYIWQYADEQELKKSQKNKKQLELELK